VQKVITKTTSGGCPSSVTVVVRRRRLSFLAMRLGSDDASLVETSVGFEPWFSGVQNEHLNLLSTTSSAMLK